MLAILALGAPQPVPASRLVDLLWPEHDPDKALIGLQSYVSNLRRCLEPTARGGAVDAVILRDVGGYRIRCDVDLVSFDHDVAAARQSRAGGDLDCAVELARRAIATSIGPPVPELADLSVVIEATDRWRRSLADAIEIVADTDLLHGDAPAALALVLDHLVEFPLDERLHGLAATAAYRSGRQTEALQILDRLRQALRETAGLEPSTATRMLEQAILAHDATLRATDGLRPSARGSGAPGDLRGATA